MTTTTTTTTATKFNVFDVVIFSRNIRLKITKIDSFGATRHYGFLSTVSNVGEPTQYESGWMPCTMLDAIGSLSEQTYL